MITPLDESTKRTIQAAARLLELGEKPEAVMELIFGLGYMEGLLKMATSQAQRGSATLDAWARDEAAHFADGAARHFDATLEGRSKP